MTETATRPARQYVDFNAVSPSQWKIHDRLLDWAKWCNATPGKKTAAGFELYRSSDARREYGAEVSVPINRDDCQRVQDGVAALPIRNRQAIQWLYLNGRDPLGNAVKLGTARQGLFDLIVEGRTLLIVRNV